MRQPHIVGLPPPRRDRIQPFFNGSAMNPEHRRQIEELYQAARDPAKRAEVLAAADPEVRRKVESLLAQDSSKTGALDQPAQSGVTKPGSGSASTVITSGVQIGSYKIEGLLGAGGMGEVFRAIDTKLNRPVAIKFLFEELADTAARRRFQREAQMASSLNHPHILTVHDAGDFEGRQFLVTEFVDGGTLNAWARRRNAHGARRWTCWLAWPTGSRPRTPPESCIAISSLPISWLEEWLREAGGLRPREAPRTRQPEGGRNLSAPKRGRGSSSGPSRTCRRNRRLAGPLMRAATSSPSESCSTKSSAVTGHSLVPRISRCCKRSSTRHRRPCPRPFLRG